MDHSLPSSVSSAASSITLQPSVSSAASSITLQPDMNEAGRQPDASNNVLWWMGGGILAILIFGFLLTRRTQQRVSDSPFDNDAEEGASVSGGGESVEELL